MRFLLIAAVIVLAGCGAAATPEPTQSAAPSSPGLGTTAGSPSQPPAAATASPRASATVTTTCIVSMPVNFFGELTPAIIQATGGSESDCAQLLAQETAAPGKTQPPQKVRLSAPPSGDPVCRVERAGVTLTIWGTSGAQLYCSMLTASPSPSPAR